MAKGQWFIISAVLASATFLTIAIFFNGYSMTDSSRVAKISEDYFFSNVMNGLNNIFENSSSDVELSEKFQNFKQFSENEAIRMGYMLSIKSDTPLRTSGTEIRMTLASTNMNITRKFSLPLYTTTITSFPSTTSTIASTTTIFTTTTTSVTTTTMQYWIPLSAGYFHTCGIAPDGNSLCWGNGINGQLGIFSLANELSPVPVQSYSPAFSISSGLIHTCGITMSGQAYCWGDNSQYQIGNGNTAAQYVPAAVSTSSRFNAISAGYYHTCAIATNGSAYCWGNCTRGQCGTGYATLYSTPAATNKSTKGTSVNFASISSGSDFTCGLATNGSAYCWGNNSRGQLGIGSSNNYYNPALVVGGPFKSIDVSKYPSSFACGVNTNGNVYCWGDLSVLGTDVSGIKTSPARMNTSGTAIKIDYPHVPFSTFSVGWAHICGSNSSAATYCFGYNIYGQLGNGNNVSNYRPVGGSNFYSVSAGFYHTCALASVGGGIWCWGYNGNAQLGMYPDPKRPYWLVPQPIPGICLKVVKGTCTEILPSTYTDVSAGGFHTCAVHANGSAYCWGADNCGQLGTGTDSRSSQLPVNVSNSFSSIEAGLYYTCGITTSGTGMCWGNNSYGQLGTGVTGGQYHQPVNWVVPGYTFSKIATGNMHTCGILTNKSVACWGRGSSGQIGTGDNNLSVNSAKLVKGSLLFKDIAVGYDFSCGLLVNGSAYCWGNNTYGQLGTGNTTSKNVPTPVKTSLIFTSIQANRLQPDNYATTFACGTVANGSVYCWGANFYGLECYIPGCISYTPVEINTSVENYSYIYTPPLKFNSITSGATYICGIATNGSAYCWGINAYGLGNSFSLNYSTPFPVNSSYAFKYLTAGYDYACGVASNNQTYCWGSNIYGKLGINSTANSRVPVMLNLSL